VEFGQGVSGMFGSDLEWCCCSILATSTDEVFMGDLTSPYRQETVSLYTQDFPGARFDGL